MLLLQARIQLLFSEQLRDYMRSSQHQPIDGTFEGLHVPKTVKRIVETRWSARHDAVFAIKSHYENVIDALEKLTQHNENADTRGEALHWLRSAPFHFCAF